MERGFFAFAIVLVVISSLVTVNSAMVEKEKSWNEEIVGESIANNNYWLKINIEQVYDGTILQGLNKSESKIDTVKIKESISELLCKCISELEEKETLDFYITSLTAGLKHIRNAEHKEINACEMQIQELLDIDSVPEPITKGQIVTVRVTDSQLYAKIGDEFAIFKEKTKVYLCMKEGKCSLLMD